MCAGAAVPAFAAADRAATARIEPMKVALRSFSARRDAAQRVVLRWRTRVEQGLIGFDIFRRRGDRIDRLTKLSVTARNAARGASYTYTDRGAGKRGAQYRLEAVLLDGTRVWLGAVTVRRIS